MNILSLLNEAVAVAQTVPVATPSTLPVVVAATPSTGSWFMANWQNVLLLVLAVDAALIPLFPQVGVLVTIKNLLAKFVTPKT